MKSIQNFGLILSLSFIAGGAAFAELKVGDSATYVGEMSGQQFDRVVTVTAATAGNPVVTVHEAISMNGQVLSEQDSSYDSSKDDLYAQTATDAGFCSRVGQANQGVGVIEQFTLATSGVTLTTCHLTLNDGSEFWLGNVPFGTVKVIRPDSELAIMMVSFVKQ